jgi:hypothetical protein
MIDNPPKISRLRGIIKFDCLRIPKSLMDVFDVEGEDLNRYAK